MSDYQTIVENIRSLIGNYGSTGNEQLEPLAESYALCCKDVNSRLLRCSQLIRSGNPSEAVRLADIEPDLLESYALLDFPERQQWSEIVRSHHLPAAAPLFEELAREINDAYTTVNPLMPLLKKHRLLALARAPLSQRIPVLREIVLMEPDNLGWKSDLDSYEKTRFRDIEKEISEAIAAKNIPQMSDLVRELDSQNWTVKPPEKLIAALRQTLKTESQRASLVELRQTADKLAHAVQTENVESAIKFADRWYVQVKPLGGNVPIDLNVEVQTPLLWVEEQRQQRNRVRDFEGQIDAFRNAIQSGLDSERMSERYAAIEAVAEEMGRTIPESITNLYRSRIESNLVRGTRRFRVFLIVLVLLGLTLASGMILGIVHGRSQAEIRKVAATLQGYLDRKDFETASQYVEEQKKKSDRIFDAPAVADVYAELRTAIDREQERQILFRSSMEKVRETLKSGTPDLFALSQAESRAQTDSEKFELKNVKDEIRNLQSEQQRRNDLALQKELDAINVSLNRLTPQKGRETDAVLLQLEELLQKSLETRKLEGAGSTVLNARDLLIGQLEQWVGEIKQRKESKGDITDLTQTVSNPDAYARTLQNLATKYPNLPMSKDFQTLLQEKAVWNLVAQWNETVKKLPNESGGRENETIVGKSEKIRLFLDEWNKSAQSFSNFPDKDSVDYCVPYFRAIEERNNHGESILFELEKQMLRHKSRPLWLYYVVKEDARYYLPQKPREGSNQYLADKQGTEKSIRIPDSLSLAEVREAPHVRFAKLAVDQIAKIDQPNGKSWAETACLLLQNLQDDPKFDPFLKFILMREFITKFGAGDLSVRKGYARHLTILEEEEPDETVDWVDPKSAEATYQRKITQAVLDRLPSSASAIAATRADVQAYHAHTISALERVGWAEKTNTGQWICNTNRTTLPSEGLYIVRGTISEEGDVTVRFEQIQIIDHAKKVMTSTPGLLFGSPVLLKIPAK